MGVGGTLLILEINSGALPKTFPPLVEVNTMARKKIDMRDYAPLSGAQILHFNAQTGERVGDFGEGVRSVALFVRTGPAPKTGDNAGKVPAPRLVACGIYRRKNAGKSRGAWTVTPDGSAFSFAEEGSDVAAGTIQVGGVESLSFGVTAGESFNPACSLAIMGALAQVAQGLASQKAA